jgi:hypothetical protein
MTPAGLWALGSVACVAGGLAIAGVAQIIKDKAQTE